MQVDVVRDTAGLLRLEGEWNDLLATSSSDGAFLTFEWLSTWWKHFHAGRELHLITIRDEGRLLAIAPFVRCGWRMRPLRIVSALEFMGVDHISSEYLDVIIRTGEEARVGNVLAGALSNRKLMLDLAQLKEGHRGVALLESRLGAQGWTAGRSTIGPCPFIRLTGFSWDGYLATLGSQHRANVRRRLRDIQKNFEMRFDAVADESARRPALDALIRLHNSRWDARGGSSAFASPAQLAFHDDVTRIFLTRGWLRLYTLRLGGEVAAALYGFVYRGKFYFYQSGFNPEYSKHSLGLVTMGLTIQAALAESLDEFDLLYGPETYKTLWAPASRALTALELCPRDARGHLHRMSVRMRDLIRPARQAARNLLKRKPIGAADINAATATALRK